MSFQSARDKITPTHDMLHWCHLYFPQKNESFKMIFRFFGYSFFLSIHFCEKIFHFCEKNFLFFWENLFIWNNSFNSIMMFSRGSSWCLNLLRLNHMQIQEIELNVCQSIAASNFPNLFYSNIDLVKTLRYIFSSFIRKNQNRIVRRPWATSILSPLFTKKIRFHCTQVSWPILR